MPIAIVQGDTTLLSHVTTPYLSSLTTIIGEHVGKRLTDQRCDRPMQQVEDVMDHRLEGSIGHGAEMIR